MPDKETILISFVAVVIATLIVLALRVLRWLIVAAVLCVLWLLLVLLFPNLPTWLATGGFVTQGWTFGTAFAIAIVLDLIRFLLGTVKPASATAEASE